MTVRRIIACILLPCYLVACTSWKTQEASPQQVLADEQPDKVQVTLTDGSKLELEEPVVSGDTLSGLDDSTPVHIPLADVADVEVRKTDIIPTVALVVLGLGVVFVGVAAIVLCTDDDITC